MPYVGYELTSERAKTVHALDRSATVTGCLMYNDNNNNNNNNNIIQFFVYLRAELNSQWLVTESAQIQ
jgi:hypothetical protein